MKKYIKIKKSSLAACSLIGLMIGVLSSSCSKSFLEKSPSDKLTPQTFFTSEEDLNLYTQSFYHRQVPTAISIVTADEMGDFTAKNNSPKFINGSFTSVDQGQWNWADLRNINYFLKYFNNKEISQEARNHHEGLARFFRAYFYFDKVKTYGDVPWYNTPIDVNDKDLLYKSQDSRTLVMDSVLADLDFAASNIRDTKDGTSAAVTRQVALAFKSRVCLFEASFRQNHTQLGLAESAPKWYQEAASAASKVVESGMYSLYSSGNPTKDYRYIFTQEQPVSQEVIWASVHNNALKKWHGITWRFTSATNGSRWSLIRQFVNTYTMNDGSRFTDRPDHATLLFKDEMEGRDPRLAQTIRPIDYKRSDGSSAPANFAYTPTGYHIYKFSLDNKALDSKDESYNSIPLIRYAEVLLNYAEAKSALNEMDADIWASTIGQIRARVGLPTAFPSQIDTYFQQLYFPEISNAAELEIRRERGIELVYEGFRFADLLRWKKGHLLEMQWQGIYVPSMNTPLDINDDGVLDVSFVQEVPANPLAGVFYYVINGTSTKLSEGNKGILIWRDDENRKFEDRKYFKPIANADIVLNPNLKQNPGWE